MFSLWCALPLHAVHRKKACLLLLSEKSMNTAGGEPEAQCLSF